MQKMSVTSNEGISISRMNRSAMHRCNGEPLPPAIGRKC
jgi:hypothetical protein